MKRHLTEKELIDESKKANTACCCSKPSEKIEKDQVCCEQPEDGTSCCDKSGTREENSESTGCC